MAMPKQPAQDKSAASEKQTRRQQRRDAKVASRSTREPQPMLFCCRCGFAVGDTQLVACPRCGQRCCPAYGDV